MKIFALGIPAVILIRIIQAALEGTKRIKESVSLNVGLSFFRLLLAGSLVVAGLGVLGAIVGYISSMIIIAIVGLFIVLKKGLFKKAKTKEASYKKILAFSLPLMFAGIITPLLSWTDTLMLGYFSSLENVGIYNIALPTAALISNVFVAFAPIFLVVITALFAQKKMKLIRKEFQTTTRWILSIVTLLTVIMISFSSDILRILFSNEYAHGGIILTVLAVGFFMEVAFGPVTQVLVAIAKTKIIMVNRICITLSNIFLNLLLVPKWGMLGAAIATALSLAGLNFLMAIQAFRQIGIFPFTVKYFKVILAGILALIITKFVIVPGGDLIQTALGIFFCIGIYSLAFLLLKCFDENDKEVLRAFLRKVGLRN